MKRLFENYGIRRMIFLYFTAAEIVFASLVVLSLYQRMQAQYISSVTEEAEIIVDQTASAVESYLQRMMKLSDSLYYGVIKNADLKDPVTAEKAAVLYDAEKELVANIGVFSGTGELEFASPAARISDPNGAAEMPVFEEALQKPDALVFSPLHVLRTFEGSEGQYRWGLTLTRAVEIREQASTHQGVLMIDLLYSGLRQYFDNVSIGTHGYIYLIGRNGEILCHPRMQLIESGIEEESELAASVPRDGTYTERHHGENRHVTVKTVGYTGWKLVGITLDRGFYLNNQKNLLFMGFIIGLLAYILALVNAYISSRITTPIRKLEHSVNEIENGDLEAEVYIGGAEEIRHLGTSVKQMTERIRGLMEDIVQEHETRRRTEFDALQSQINPHFLYNTLDIIVWMIENEEKEKAVQMVTALGRFFRISLSRGRSIIPVKDELEHVRNYLMIQQNRFKNKFSWRIEADDAVLRMASVKLILQPVAENSIYHGMEFMDGDGEILVKAELKDGDTVLTVEDNGLGMTQETVEKLLSGTGPHAPSRRGSGIGVRNVHERIRIYFGEPYGLEIHSEPDEGTRVTIRMPAVPYSESGDASAGTEGT